MSKIVEVLGVPPTHIIERAARRDKYFERLSDGTWTLRKHREGRKVQQYGHLLTVHSYMYTCTCTVHTERHGHLQYTCTGTATYNVHVLTGGNKGDLLYTCTVCTNVHVHEHVCVRYMYMSFYHVSLFWIIGCFNDAVVR